MIGDIIEYRIGVYHYGNRDFFLMAAGKKYHKDEQYNRGISIHFFQVENISITIRLYDSWNKKILV